MKSKKLIALLLILIIPFTLVFAEGEGELGEEYGTGLINSVQETTPQTAGQGTLGLNLGITDGTNILDSDVTIDEVGNKLLGKLYDVANVMKRIAAPLSIIMFVVGAILMVTGALGKKDGAKSGIVVCILSVVMYAICMYSEPIIAALSN